VIGCIAAIIDAGGNAPNGGIIGGIIPNGGIIGGGIPGVIGVAGDPVL